MSRSTWPRLAGVGGVIALVLLAVSMPRPPSAPGPDFSEVIEPPAEGLARPSVWHCPWINSGADRRTDVAVAFLPDVDLKYTHPDPRVGEPADEGQFVATGPGAVLQDVAEIVNRGDAPGFIEFSDGPATASAIVTGDASGVSGDRCVGSVPKKWHIAGLTTRDGYDLTLRLFNPIPDNAKVLVRAASELGSEALPDLSTIDVVGQTWQDFDLSELIPFLDNLVITVEAEEGLVIPGVVQGRAGDEAHWAGTGLSTEWYFPASTLAALTPRLAVWNPNEGPVDVEVDLYSRTSVSPAVFSATVEAGRPVEFPLADESAGAVALRVRATGAVAAAVVAEDVPPEATPGQEDNAEDAPRPTRIAATTGSPEEALSWLLPGAGGPNGGDSSLWLLNTSAEAVTVTVQPLGQSELAADKVRLEPNSFTRVRLTTSAQIAGYRIDSAIPVSASWSLQTESAVALFAGIAIEE